MSEPGPDLLHERTLWGIFVHLLSPFFGLFLAGPLYLLSDHPFTTENARNVINWWITVLLVLLGLFGWILLDVVGLPDGLMILIFLPLVVAFAYITIGTMLFAIVGAVKAIFGSTWKYPLAPEFVGKSEN